MTKLKSILAVVFVVGLLSGTAFAMGMGGGSGTNQGGRGGRHRLLLAQMTNPSGDMNEPGGTMNTPGMENTPGESNPGSGY